MKRNEWITLIILIIVISAIVAYITGSITGNAVGVRSGTNYRVYTQAEMDAKLKMLGPAAYWTNLSNADYYNLIGLQNYKGILSTLNKCSLYDKVLNANLTTYTSCNQVCSGYAKTCILGEVHTSWSNYDKTALIDCSSGNGNDPSGTKFIHCWCC